MSPCSSTASATSSTGPPAAPWPCWIPCASSSRTPPTCRLPSRGVNNPEDPAAGEREIPFGPELFIEREDFAEIPPPKYFRLSPGKAVRLRNAGFLTCTGVDKDDAGKIIAVRGTFAPMDAALKVKATIHWVPAHAAKPVEVRLYDRLFNVPEPDGDKAVDFKSHLNPDSLRTLTALVEPTCSTPSPATASSSSASATSAPTRQPPRRPRLQPHRHPEGFLEAGVRKHGFRVRTPAFRLLD
jgi:hypothetical protein